VNFISTLHINLNVRGNFVPVLNQVLHHEDVSH